MRVFENRDEVAELLDLLGAVAEFVRVVEVGEVAAGEAGVGVDKRLDDLSVDQVADVAVALERDHVLEARALRDLDGRGEVVRVGVFVGDVLDEQHEQHVVLVLAGIHAAAQFIARLPEGRVEIGFLDGHIAGCRLCDSCLPMPTVIDGVGIISDRVGRVQRKGMNQLNVGDPTVA